MKGDFSRRTFDPSKHYSRVLMQQGRVQLDADWNEQGDIHAHRMTTAARDLIGAFGVPRDNPGFAIMAREGLRFDGQGAYIYLGESRALSLARKQPFTIEAWVNPAPGGSGGAIISKYDTTEHGRPRGEYLLAIQPDGRIVFRRVERKATVEIEEQILTREVDILIEDVEFVEHSEVVLQTMTSRPAVPFGAWSHVAVTFDGAELTIYIDARAVAHSRRDYPGEHSNVACLIGAAHHHHQAAQFFHGSIDDVRIWRAARSREQLERGMFRRLSRHERREVVHWPLADDLAGRLEWAGEIEHRRGKGQRPAEPAPPEVWVRKGRCYVDGLLCENEQDIRLAEQAAGPRGQPDVPSDDGRYLAFLDVWERFVSAVEDPAILEPALGGVDTAARLKLVWQVKVLPAEAAERLIGEPYRPGTLRARRVRSGAMLENRLYRVEVHQGGGIYGAPAHDDDQIVAVKQIVAEHNQVTLGAWPSAPSAWQIGQFVEICEALAPHGKPGTLARITALEKASHSFTLSALPAEGVQGRHLYLRRIASFKWSRDNGALAFPIARVLGTSVTVSDSGQARSLLQEGDWVGIADDDLTLSGQAEPLYQIAQIVDGGASRLQVRLQAPMLPSVSEQARHLLLRRWDQHGQAVDDAGGCLVVSGGGWLDLEDGLQVLFEGSGSFQSGDFWQIPARAPTQNIDWPRDASGPLPRPPEQIAHHYAPLALLQREDGRLHVEDLRPIFTTLGASPTSDAGNLMTENLLADSSHAVRGDVLLDADGTVGTLHDHNAAHTVDTSAILNHAVTADRPSTDVGLVPLAHVILGPDKHAPSGYHYTGASIVGAATEAHWRRSPVALPVGGHVTALALNNKIYVLFASGRLWVYDPTAAVAEQWTPRSDLPGAGRCAYGAAILNNRISIVGGIDSSGAKTGRHDQYDPELDEWVSKAPLPKPRSHLALGATNDKLYAFGGRRTVLGGLIPNWVTRANDVYDPATDTWSAARAMPTARYACRAGVVSGNLYVIGGERKRLFGLLGTVILASNEVYSPAADRWMERSPMLVPTSYLGLTPMQDRLCVVGGKLVSGQTAICELYHPATDSWALDMQMHIPRIAPGVAMLGPVLYSMGGEIPHEEAAWIEERAMASVFYIHQKD